MSSIAILTDSNCGITRKEAEPLGFHVLPMPFSIDGKDYLEEVDMNLDEFFDILAKNPAAKVATSQPSIENLTGTWDALLKEYDEIVHIPMSSGLSSSCQTATMLAREEYAGRVWVADSKRISGSLRYSCLEAVQQVKNGLTGEQVRDWLEATGMDSSIYITVATLSFLKKGGRLTPAVAAIGSLLKLKPVLQIQGAKLDTYKKPRTMAQAKKFMTEAIKDDMKNRFGNEINLDVIHSANLEMAKEFRKETFENFPEVPGMRERDVVINPLSISVSCHIGPGSLAYTCSKVHPEIW